MPRCITCNSCSEIDGTPHNAYHWDESVGGYSCTECRRVHRALTYKTPQHDISLDGENFKGNEDGEVAILDNDILETLEFLPVPRMGKREGSPEDDWG